MKSNILHSTARIIILVFCVSLLIPFQNCSVYQSDGRKEFESGMKMAENRGCYPYIDTNMAMSFLGMVNDSFSVSKTQVSGEDAYSCDFYAPGYLLGHVICKVSEGNGEQALLVVQYGVSAIPDTVSVWTAGASGMRTGFVGSNHGGFVTLDSDGLYTIKYVALDGSEEKGVGCSVRLSVTDYNANMTSTRDSLSKMALEMAIQNQE